MYRFYGRSKIKCIKVLYTYLFVVVVVVSTFLTVSLQSSVRISVSYSVPHLYDVGVENYHKWIVTPGYKNKDGSKRRCIEYNFSPRVPWISEYKRSLKRGTF